MSQKNQIAKYILAYLCWFISLVVAVLILNLVRETILLAMTVSGASITNDSEAFYQSLRAGTVAQWSWLFVGLITIALLVGFEHLYRNAVPARNLWKYFFLVTGIQGAVLLLTHAIYFALERTFRPGGWLPFAILAVEALAAGLFLWLWNTRRRNTLHEQP